MVICSIFFKLLILMPNKRLLWNSRFHHIRNKLLLSHTMSQFRYSQLHSLRSTFIVSFLLRPGLPYAFFLLGFN